MLLNNILIVVILIAVFAGAIFWVNRTAQIEEAEDVEQPYSMEYLQDYVHKTFQTTLRRNLQDMNLSRQELAKEEKIKRELRDSIRKASLGDMQAKKFIKASMIPILCRVDRMNTINEITINNVIPFDEPEKMTTRDKFETLLYCFENHNYYDEDGQSKIYGVDGIKEMFKLYGFTKPVKGTNKYCVTAEQIDEAYMDFFTPVDDRPGVPNNILTYFDKQQILSQILFSNLYGFGAVDSLLNTSVDEVQGGTSGMPKGSYESKVPISDDAQYSFESIWIVMSGLTIHMECLSFGSQDELIRVCNNIYKYESTEVMTKKNGKAVATMKDGSRIVVARPPFADSYSFLARKFDSAPSIAPRDIIRDTAGDFPIFMAKWLIKGCCNCVISGDQGTGKTTMLKSFIRFIREDYSLRIQELTPELNIRYAYPDRNVISFRETENISSQEGLNLQKKTSGTVNIIGEVATAEAASWIIQTAKVASKQSLFTHHAKTVNDFIVAIRNNLMEVNSYTDNNAVDEMIADTINIDVHLERKKGHRFIGRITEIMPIRDRSYPEEMSIDDDIQTLEKKNIINSNEYRKRRSDRALFSSQDLIRYNEDTDQYELVNMPSEPLLTHIKEILSRDEELEMIEDIKKIIAYGENNHFAYNSEDLERARAFMEKREAVEMENGEIVTVNDDVVEEENETKAG